jgi:hypothetical protein
MSSVTRAGIVRDDLEYRAVVAAALGNADQ